MSGIEAALKRLDRIAIIILQATQNSLVRRMAVYTVESRNESFEKHVDNVLRYRFQDALPAGLRELIYSSILHRYYRIRYERDHRNQEKPRWEQPPIQQVPERIAERSAHPAPSLQPAASAQPEIIPEQTRDTISEAQTQPLTVDEEIVREKLKEGLSATPSRRNMETASRSETGDALYPKAPEIRDGQKTAICTICLRDYEADVFKEQKWRYDRSISFLKRITNKIGTVLMLIATCSHTSVCQKTAAPTYASSLIDDHGYLTCNKGIPPSG